MKKNGYNILIVDDEKKICGILSEILKDEGYSVRVANNGKDAQKVIKDDNVDLVLLDLKLPDTNGMTLLQEFKKAKADISIVMISAFGTISKAVEATKLGADDFIEKPLETTRVLTTIKNAIEKRELFKESERMRNDMLERYRMLGESEKIKQVISIVEKVAPTNAIVLIQGESGTGKELVARLTHNRSIRFTKPFVKVNCAAIPGELIESELFGYEKGAFTGAYGQKKGQFEIANTGTLFLDEIGDMSKKAQAKVLGAIEEGNFRRIGGKEAIDIDVRIVAATNKDLRSLIEEKKFREDLYQRLNVVSIFVPPLRERKEDVSTLAESFIRETCSENNREIKRLTKGAVRFLQNCKWPGNVRELKHLMSKLVILEEATSIKAEHIEKILGASPKQISVEGSFQEAKDRFERDYIISILNRNRWKISDTARELKMDRSSLFRKMKKMNIRKI